MGKVSTSLIRILDSYAQEVLISSYQEELVLRSCVLYSNELVLSAQSSTAKNATNLGSLHKKFHLNSKS